MIVYIAGPMAGIAEDNANAFAAAEKRLKALGMVVINPTVLPKGLRHESYMPICLSMIDACDAVVLLPGWGRAAGAQIEEKYAKAQGKTVAEYEWFVGEEKC